MFTKTSLFLAALLLIATLITAHGSGSHKCNHDLQNHPAPEIGPAEDYIHTDSDRRLASYNNLRINAMYNFVAGDSTQDQYKAYFQNKLVPPIIDYFSSALKVKYPLTQIKFSTSTFCSGVTVPAELKAGLQTDLYWIVGIKDDDDTNAASSTSCYLTTSSKRPYVGKTAFNAATLLIPADASLLTHEKNMILAMHEFTHILGFSTNLYSYYLDANGNRRTGHVTTQLLDGVNASVLNVEPLTSMLKSHFGCSSITGAYMENSGDDGTAGSHFERRHFGFEYMTSGNMFELQVSNFTLALLEGTGWYTPDYTYADHFTWGQGQGCNFLFQSCSASSFDFEEFCTGTTRGCAQPGRGGGTCSTDARSGGCSFIHPDVDFECESSNAGSQFRLPTIQSFGRDTGSKCFTGTLSSSSKTSTLARWCFKYNCGGDRGPLTVTVGNQNITCAKQGTVSVNGYYGSINCPDPLAFCSTVGKKTCPRGCMGRGTCVKGACVCNSGFSGKDCALGTSTVKTASTSNLNVETSDGEDTDQVTDANDSDS